MPSRETVATYALLGTVTVAGVVAMPVFNRIALRRDLVAKMNARTLHEHIVPRGGGVVFAVVFSIATVVLWLMGRTSTPMLAAVGGGGLAAAAIGFADDVHDLPARLKFMLHVLLSVLMLAVFWPSLYADPLQPLGPAVLLVGVGVLLFVPMWLINMYNFIDGIDGLAIGGAFVICLTASIALRVTGGWSDLLLLFALLGASSLGFLWWNRPPARVFMGDSGSMFLGYCFAALVLATVASGQLSPWTWLAIFAYYVADTTTTTLCRMVLVKEWYRGHRSHAYQNIARIRRSHALVTYGVMAYQTLWAGPLAIWSAMQPQWAIVAAGLAVIPVVLWTLRFGPPLSSE